MKSQLTSLASEEFNSVGLFGGSTLSVVTTEDAGQSVSIDQSDLTTAVTSITGAADLSDISIGTATTAIQNVANLRAANGAQTSRLQFASGMLSVNRTNLEAANSRIIDTDVAFESTQFARFSILVQSGAAMLAQANASAQVSLRLLS